MMDGMKGTVAAFADQLLFLSFRPSFITCEFIQFNTYLWIHQIRRSFLFLMECISDSFLFVLELFTYLLNKKRIRILNYALTKLIHSYNLHLLSGLRKLKLERNYNVFNFKIHAVQISNYMCSILSE
jgi:hypothetical protein